MEGRVNVWDGRRVPIWGMMVLVCAVGYGGAEPPDGTTPRGAAVAFARAMDVGDAAGAKAAAVEGEANVRIVEAMASMTRSQQRLLKVATERFGPGASALVGPYARPGLEETVGRSTLTVDGDTAALRERPGVIFLKLRRGAEGRWRVDVSGSSDAEAMRKEVPLLESSARLCDDTADAVAGGRYATVEAARDGMIEQIRGRRGATRPATAQAKTAGSTTKP